MLSDGWIIEDFMAVQTSVIAPTKGWTKKGLGLYRNFAGFWWLVHLNTGHGVVRLGVEDAHGMAHETRQDILPVADAIAEAADWHFSDAGGWRSRNPDLPTKLQAIADRFEAGMVTTPAAANGRRNGRAARGVALSRMDS